MNRIAALLAAAMLVCGAPALAYTTTFPADESPIFESGAWNHVGLDWTMIETDTGVAYGTQDGLGETDDSYAYVTGYTADQRGEATLFRSASAVLSCSKEVEILLHWADAAHNARGYEVSFSVSDQSVQVVRWNGPFDSYTAIGGGPVSVSLHDGDVVRGEIVGTTIRAYVNGVQKLSITDGTYTDGQPGMGMFRRSCGTARDVGFKDYTATSLPEPGAGMALACGALLVLGLRRR